jgi:phenylpropionate dioxygenase-like ring-hydroxylating dioxygenase large terminal subunit
LPLFAAEDDARLRKLNCGPYDVATSAPRIVENFLDMAHFGFVHEGWLGMRAQRPLTTTPCSHTHRPAGHAVQGLAAAVQPAFHRPAQVEYTYEVTAPYARRC